MHGRRTRLAALLAAAALLAVPVALLRNRKLGRRIVRKWLALAAATMQLELVVRGEPVRGSALWCANHVSWLDVVALGALSQLAFVSKSEVRNWPLIGWCAAAAGTLFIRRGADSGTNRAIASKLRRGHSVAIFPEGTTGDGERPRPFHPRLFAAAIATACPVQPVAVRYSEEGSRSTTAPFVGDDSFVPHLLRVLACKKLCVELAFAAPIDPATASDRRALAERAAAAIAFELAELPELAPIPGPATGRRLDASWPRRTAIPAPE